MVILKTGIYVKDELNKLLKELKIEQILTKGIYMWDEVKALIEKAGQPITSEETGVEKLNPTK
jgi:hypothetical protein